MLEALRKVYEHDALAKDRELTPLERLAFHQQLSGPVMADLATWLNEQLDGQVEPNSTLGQAMRYLQKHWQALTLFLREPGAPLDNNICERALKRVILHRRTATSFAPKTAPTSLMCS